MNWMFHSMLFTTVMVCRFIFIPVAWSSVQYHDERSWLPLYNKHLQSISTLQLSTIADKLWPMLP